MKSCIHCVNCSNSPTLFTRFKTDRYDMVGLFCYERVATYSIVYEGGDRQAETMLPTKI